jgi:hypothetical protein
VKVLALALADEAQRFIKGYPPKGARLFLKPNLEISRLAALLSEHDQFRYLDERVETLEPDGSEDIVLCHVGLTQANPARDLAARLADGAGRLVFFGPLVTAWGDLAPEWAGHRVVGDVTSVWPELKQDAESGAFKPVYRAPLQPAYVVPRRGIARNPEMIAGHQPMNFVRGCFCAEPVRRFCPEYLYFGTNVLIRSPEEVIGEVLSVPGKRIQLLDEDVARFPDYYYDLFRSLWNYRRQWLVNASDRLFEQPRLIRLLAKAGVRMVFLNDAFLEGRLDRAGSDGRTVKWLYRRVKSLQAAKMLVGARATLRLEPDVKRNFEPVAGLLRKIDLDFVELRFIEPGPDGTDRICPVAYHPMVSNHEPGHIKNRFYAMEAIIDRLLRRPRRVGFYTTATYLLPWSMAYRQSFLEGIPFP